MSYLFDITHEQPLLRQKNIPGVQGNQVVAEKEGAVRMVLLPYVSIRSGLLMAPLSYSSGKKC